NRAFFARAANLLLSRTTADRTYVVLDEAREAGRLDGLRSLLNTGRSKGVSVLLGFQDFDGLTALYGREEAHELTGQCAHKTFLRTDSTATAQWMQAHAGRVLVREAQPSVDPARITGLPQSVSYQRVERHLVLAAEFMDLPPTSAAHGLRAFHLLPEARNPYWTNTPLATVLAALPRPDAAVPAHVPRPAELQRLRPWDDADARRLGVTVGEGSKEEINRKQDADAGTEEPPEDGPLPPEPPQKPVKPPPPAAGGSPAERLRNVRRGPPPTEEGTPG
ncbi:MAG TPA: type IV secretion system DNA-binding domain-containing protein, partial [Verrucomicrobiota bacterium]|nr:type IV secretion system DNA-binding domain-containing protein [Verrucomicrobiota bacterium]